MRKDRFLAGAVIVALQISSASFAAAADQSDGSGKAVPSWAYQEIDGLMKSGLIDSSGAALGGALPREEAAALVARALVKMENEEGTGVLEGDHKAALDEIGSTTRLIAKLEAMEARAPEELHKSREEYMKAEEEMNVWAGKLAGAELADTGSSNLEKTEAKYQAAVQRFGIAARRLAQAERGNRDRALYIRQLKEEKAAAMARLQGGSSSEPAGARAAYTAAERSAVDRLKREFGEELANMGYGAVEVSQMKPAKQEGEEKFKISGELRYNYAASDGLNGRLSDDSRLRLRLYGEARLNRDWSAYTMVESDKSFLQDGRDGHPKWERFYVQGKTGATVLTAGSFGYMIAEGNVYDSSFKGVVAEFGSPTRLRAGWGRTSNNGFGYLASAAYKTNDYNVEGGLYRYEDDSAHEKNTISYFGGNYLWGRYSLGAMYLRSSRPDTRGDRDGYVLTLGYGTLKTWKPGSYAFYGKYYDQARGTYIEHTMTGPAGYMEGFKGLGLGVYYTVAENLVYGLEYYNLEDKISGEKGRTLWNQISYYF